MIWARKPTTYQQDWEVVKFAWFPVKAHYGEAIVWVWLEPYKQVWTRTESPDGGPAHLYNVVRGNDG